MCAKIDAVTSEDIRRVVRKVLKKPPTVATVGIDVKNVPKVDEVVKFLGAGLPPPEKKSWF